MALAWRVVVALAFQTGSVHHRIVRFFLALALAVHLSGVPAVVAAPCAGGSEDAHSCCANHGHDGNGPASGGCCCAPASNNAAPGAIAVGSASPDRHDAPGLAHVPPSASPAESAMDAVVRLIVIPVDTSPPRLSSTGFRC
jgi:hypothetical protein